MATFIFILRISLELTSFILFCPASSILLVYQTCLPVGEAVPVPSFTPVLFHKIPITLFSLMQSSFRPALKISISFERYCIHGNIPESNSHLPVDA